MSEQPTPVFIVGSGRSGTTVTASLLNFLPGVQISKETGFIGPNTNLLLSNPGLDQLVNLIPQVNSWLEKDQWENKASAEGFRSFCDRYNVNGGSAFVHYVWQLDSAVPWHELSCIGDNTPLYVMAIPAILQLMPNARFIHMIRDPRDVVCSILKMRFGADELATAATEWHLYLGCWLMAERVVPAEQRMECRYEDLCTDPAGTFSSIAKFIGRTEEEAAAALALHASNDRKVKTGFEKIAKWSHHTRIYEPLSPARIGRYKTEFTPLQIQQIEEIAQYGMLAFGYQPTKWHMHPLMHEDRVRILRSMVKDFAIRCFKRLRGQ